jgi:isopenicillin-N epimerase
MERQPVQFLARDLESLLDHARAELARFVSADPRDIAFVPNATTGVNAVLRWMKFEPGDELLTTDHAYNACRNALEQVAAHRGVSVVVAQIPFPISSEDQVVDSILHALTPKTRIALIDHVTSSTALVLPVGRIVAELASRGVETLVDGAHAPGMIALDLDAIGAAWYTGNCHKWMCAPKGAGFLHVRRDKQHDTHPAVTSHGARTTRVDRCAFRLEFDWTGTADPSPYLCVPEAIRFIGSLTQGGWPDVMRRNRALAMSARDRLCACFGDVPPAPDSMIGAMCTVFLPDIFEGRTSDPQGFDPLQTALVDRFHVEVPVAPWHGGKRMIRTSSQLYNQGSDYDVLVRALKALEQENRAALARGHECGM